MHKISISLKFIVGSFSIFFVILIWHVLSLLPFLHAKRLVTLGRHINCYFVHCASVRNCKQRNYDEMGNFLQIDI